MGRLIQYTDKKKVINMIKNVIKYLDKKFIFLINESNFDLVKNECDLEEFQFLEIIYRSENMLIKIEKYRHEFYIRIGSNANPDDWADLFMIIEYINRNKNIEISSKYFQEEEDLEECYKKQIDWTSATLHEYIEPIKSIYTINNYELELKKINKFASSRANEFFDNNK